jgi:hypothetical protein
MRTQELTPSFISASFTLWPAFLPEAFSGSHQSLQDDDRPRPLPSKSFLIDLPTYHSELYSLATDPLSHFLWLYSPLGLGRFFGFLKLYTLGRTPWTGDQPVGRPLLTHRTTSTQNKRTQTSMPRVGFEPTTPVLKREKNGSSLRPRGHCDRLVTGSVVK